MWTHGVLTGFLLLITGLHAAPHNTESTSDEKNIVYVVNIYAVRNMETKVLGRIIDENEMRQMPRFFESIGSILIADYESDEPFTFDYFLQVLSDSSSNVNYEKLNKGNETRVVEWKYDEADSDEMSPEEFVQYLKDRGLVVGLTVNDDTTIFEIAYNSSIKNHEDLLEFTLDELADFLEEDGHDVERVMSKGKVIKIKIIFYDSDEESNESHEETVGIQRNDEVKPVEKKYERKDQTVANTVEKNDNRKFEEKIEWKEEKFVVHDFLTRSDSMNKIRRRRSACPECKIESKIKEFISKYETHKNKSM